MLKYVYDIVEIHDIQKIILFQKKVFGQKCVIQIAAKGLKYMPERVLTKFQKKKKKKKKKKRSPM